MSSESILLGALIGDALSLGPHWIYEQDVIAEKLGSADSFNDPISDYHPGKRAGDFTHFGDQLLHLLTHLSETRKFNLHNYALSWRSYWENPANTSYRDGATRSTLILLQAGLPPGKAGSTSNDLAGAARIAPLFLIGLPENDLLFAVRELTAFTHNDPAVIEAAEFFTRLILLVGEGRSIPYALASLEARSWKSLPAKWFASARHSSSSSWSDTEAMASHGLSCHIGNAFPGVLHLLLRHASDPETALIANARAGGDTATRSLFLGMIYGACGLLEAFPDRWMDGLNARDRIVAALVGLAARPFSDSSEIQAMALPCSGCRSEGLPRPANTPPHE